MSSKINIYSHILNFGLIFIKNFVSAPFYRRLDNKKSKCIASLLHLIPSRLYESEYTVADKEYIEGELKYFVDHYPDHSDVTFLTIMDAGIDLFDEVNTKVGVDWQLPENVRDTVNQFRDRNSKRFNVGKLEKE
ncbi:hypothetical protein [Zooshikella ganghwensis]|uniref:Uncharacterized protein n=1 Tax=Zooshikella ganghwensis TaxID=202772 RepID=A0A4P9VGD2_9GAMM|nr:hypothetical protein [Zooshikella ganghwensis]RDH42198.1 hypothetical protein B9G39_01355 [Zooshikella ganghwensis]